MAANAPLLPPISTRVENLEARIKGLEARCDVLEKRIDVLALHMPERADVECDEHIFPEHTS